MAFRYEPVSSNLIWRAPLSPQEPALAASLRDSITELRPHLLDFLHLDEAPPPQAMTLTEWRQSNQLRSLLAIYSDHIYRNHPAQIRENKPLLSLWAQWYIGLQIPPLLLALLTQRRAVDLSPEYCHVEFHETGRAACFWLDLHQDHFLTLQSPHVRIEHLVTKTLRPIVAALEATGEIHGKLIWSNTGYLINWYLGEMKTVLGDERVHDLRQHLFLEKQFSDGQENPLWRTVILRDGLLTRRTCCQRYRLPDVQQCGDCTR